MWALAGLGVLVWAKLPIPSILASHAWGRQGQQTEHAKGVMGRAACSPALLHPVLCPPRLEPEWPTGLEASSCVQDENASKAPIFSTLQRRKVSRCEAGLHLDGTGEGATICRPSSPPLCPGETGETQHCLLATSFLALD